MGLAARLRKAVHRWRGYRAALDGIREQRVIGWAAPTGLRSGPLRVALCTEYGRMTEALAAIHRLDLERAGLGGGSWGFELRLDPATSAMIKRAGGRFRLHLLGPAGQGNWALGPQIGAWNMGSGRAARRLLAVGPRRGSPAMLLACALGHLERLGAIAVPPEAPAPRWRHQIFAPVDPSGPAAADLPPRTAYGDYVRLRGMTGGGTEAADPQADLFVYLLEQSLRNGGQRPPLSAAQIRWLNAFEPEEAGQMVPPLTRAVRMLLPLVPHLADAEDAGTQDWRERVLLWWLLEGARDLHLEDCLLPDRLCLWAGEPAAGQDAGRAAAALGRGFPELAGLPPADLLAVLVLLALERPDLLRLLPRAALNCLEPGPQGESSAAERLVRRLAAEAGAPALREARLTPRLYADILRHRGFDLETRRFLSLTPEGDRLEPMMLGLPQPAQPVADVQLIGPIGKASGLGQAARLSAAALAQSPFAVRSVSFGIDNPTPEDKGRRGSGAARLGPARINLIHLNAEAVPTAFAHLPDVFSDAWNIGYVFWELDSPAPCHQLAFGLLDEIWVSSQFGVSVFAPHAGIPVTNVGMCFEPLPPELAGEGAEGSDPALRRRGRELLARHLPLPPEAFVFLITFDSFSFIQRKNPLGAVLAFRQAFPPEAEDGARMRLVLKTHNRAGAGDPAQAATWAELDRLLAADPRLVLIDETFGYGDLLALLAAADGYVSLHRAEGWGFGMIEAMALGVPVLCTAYSGNMEFCSDETAFLVGWTPVPARAQDYIFVQEGHVWAEPDISDAARQMRLMAEDRDLRSRRAAAAKENVRTNFSPNAVARRYANRIDQILLDISHPN